jgi:hypothetical protein
MLRDYEHSQVMKILLVFAVIVVAFISTACSPVEDVQNWRYEYYRSKASEWPKSGDPRAAEEALREALHIATERSWISRIVSTRQELAIFYLSTKDQERWRKELSEARAMCIQSPACPGDLLRGTFGFALWDEVYMRKDKDQLNRLLREIVENKDRLISHTESIQSVFEEWRSELESQGFVDEALWLKTHLRN